MRVHEVALTLHQLLHGHCQNPCYLVWSNPIYKQSYCIYQIFCLCPFVNWAYLVEMLAWNGSIGMFHCFYLHVSFAQPKEDGKHIH